MSDMSINGATGAGYTQQLEGAGKLPQIIDVKTGEGVDRAGFLTTVYTNGSGAVSGVEGILTPSQVQDLEELLALLGLDGENAKHATLQTVLKAIQSAIHQQSVTVTTCRQAISDYDVKRLKALREAMKGSDDAAAKKIVENVDRMLELKTEIEDLVVNKGMVYDGKFEAERDRGETTNFELNTRVRELGDRIADIRTYKGRLDSGELGERLDTLAPAMKTAVKDLLAAYDRTSGWGVQVNIDYSKMTVSTLLSFSSVIASSDLKFPPQVSKDALLQVLKEIAENLGTDATAAQVEEKIEEKMAEILAQLNEVASQRPIRA